MFLFLLFGSVLIDFFEFPEGSYRSTPVFVSFRKMGIRVKEKDAGGRNIGINKSEQLHGRIHDLITTSM